jgi:restriction endonuclease S subunit
MLNLNSKIVGRIPVALPDENHQEIVVELLDDIDGQIKTLTKRVNDTQRIKAVLLHTVSGGVE